MKVGVSTVAKWIIYITMVAALSLLKPIGEIVPVFAFGYAIWWTNIILIMIALVLLILVRRKRIGTGYLFALIGTVLVTFFARLIVDTVKGRNVYKELNAYSPYLFILLAIVIYDLLDRNVISLNRLIDIIIFLTLLSYALRTGISMTYTITGKRILSSIALESAGENWIRGGTLRINPPCFAIIMVPLCTYEFSVADTAKRKWYYALACAAAILYSALVHCARSMFIYQIIELIFIVYIVRKGTINSILLFLIGGILIDILLNMGFADRLLEMFAVNSRQYGYSNSVRALMYPYYFKMFLKHFWLGNGLLIEKEVQFYAGGGLSDVGALRSLVTMGFGILAFYVLFFVRGFAFGLETLKKTSSSSSRILVLGITISVLLTICNIDCFYPIFAYAVPFAIAIVEYTYIKNKIH